MIYNFSTGITLLIEGEMRLKLMVQLLKLNSSEFQLKVKGFVMLFNLEISQTGIRGMQILSLTIRQIRVYQIYQKASKSTLLQEMLGWEL